MYQFQFTELSELTAAGTIWGENSANVSKDIPGLLAKHNSVVDVLHNVLKVQY